MRIAHSAAIGISSIRRHKLRSVLTALGIIMGIGSILAMVSLGSSFESYIVGSYSNTLMPNEFVVSIGQKSGSGTSGSYYSVEVPVFTTKDIHHIQNESGITSVLPFGAFPGNNPNSVKFGNVSIFGSGATATEPSLNKFFRIANGSTFTSTSQCVVGSSVASAIDSISNKTSPAYAIGKVISVNLSGSKIVDFTISGVLAASPLGINGDVFVDQSYYNQTGSINGTNYVAYTDLAVLTGTADQVSSGISETLAYLNSSSQAKEILKDYANLNLGFVTFSQTEIIQFIDQEVQSFAGFIIALGSVALLVGMVGIANIMLVSVSERVREVGMLRAVGARKLDIMEMFLVEVLILGLIGSLIGVLVGIALGFVFLKLGLFGGASVPLVIDWAWVPLAILLGMAISVIAGLYPAYKASRISPTEAIRSE